MTPEDIDDLFRDKLACHATPPADDLWARLQRDPAAAPDAPGPVPAERLDQIFQQGLRGHATPPGRALWERLEDEHLRPRQRRAAAWWPMALAAAVALLLVAGGTRLWLAFPTDNTRGGTVASGQTKNTRQIQNKKASADKFNGQTNDEPALTAAHDAAVAKEARASKVTKSDNERALASTTTSSLAAETRDEMRSEAATQKNLASQATRSRALASTAPKANRAAAGHSPRQPMGANRQPDAATARPSLVARTTPRQAPTLPPLTAADEQRPNAATAPTLAITPQLAPTPEIVRPEPVPATTLASTSDLITVEVRNGDSPATRRAKTGSSDLAESEAPAERRGLGGRLLQQAGHLARGERVSLAEVTGLPENVTLRATVGGRSVSKSIRL